MNTLLRKMRRMAVPVAAALLLLSSCVKGFESDEKWESTVKDSQLTNPKNVVIAIDPANEQMIVGWDIVNGAGGYEVALFNVNDPENPQQIGDTRQIDGIETRFDSIPEDTEFLVEIQTLGNEAMNNEAAAAPEEVKWTNILPVYKTIPAGSDLATWFAANPVPASADELCYQLEAGGQYTMSGNISFGPSDVTMRGDRNEHARIALTDGSFVSEGYKIKLQYLDIDANTAASGTGTSLFLMSSNFPTEGLTNGYFVGKGIFFQESKVVGLKGYIFYDSGKKWALTSLLFKDCIVGKSTGGLGQAYIRFQSGMVRNLTLDRSTFFNETTAGGSRFIQISSGRASNVGGDWLGGTLTVTNCTFYQVAYNQQTANSNGAFQQAGDKIFVQRNIFVNTAQNSNNMRNFRFTRTTAPFTGGQNSQWWDGEDLYTRTGSNEGEYDTNPVLGDPGLTHLGNGEFRMTGAAQLAARTGDPRWLPAE